MSEQYRATPETIKKNIADIRHLLSVHEFNLMSSDE